MSAGFTLPIAVKLAGAVVVLGACVAAANEKERIKFIQEALYRSGLDLANTELVFVYGAAKPAASLTDGKDFPWTLKRLDTGVALVTRTKGSADILKKLKDALTNDCDCLTRLLDKLAANKAQGASKNTAQECEAKVGSWNAVFKDELSNFKSGECK